MSSVASIMVLSIMCRMYYGCLNRTRYVMMIEGVKMMLIGVVW